MNMTVAILPANHHAAALECRGDAPCAPATNGARSRRSLGTGRPWPARLAGGNATPRPPPGALYLIHYLEMSGFCALPVVGARIL